MATRKPSATKTAVKKIAATKPVSKGGDAAAGYISQQAPDKRALLEKLRVLVAKGVPDATATIKWGVPIYVRNGKNVCALATFKDHVAINFFAPPELLADPRKKLEGSGKGSRLLKVRSTEDLDSAGILRWLKAAVAANS